MGYDAWEWGDGIVDWWGKSLSKVSLGSYTVEDTREGDGRKGQKAQKGVAHKLQSQAHAF